MGTHVFVDETKKDGYLIIAALVRTEHLAAARRVMRGMLLPNQRRIHFKDERPARKLRILDAIDDTGAVGLAFRASAGSSELDGRAECLRRWSLVLPD